MKSFKRLVLAHLRDITGSLLDPLQFAYRANRSVDDQHGTALHTATPQQTRELCKDPLCGLSLAFNTITPDLLLSKLTQLSVPMPICQWITNFLMNRQQGNSGWGNSHPAPLALALLRDVLSTAPLQTSLLSFYSLQMTPQLLALSRTMMSLHT
ncbi:hypothetical protein LDENG_00221970 [Lucifuga dentata]|nr:hypothetical protein LDENG_00221970 [Lucifuga dentata]